MQELTKKQKLKKQELKPKIKLRKERKKHELTTVFMADLIGLKNRRQYELKENGKAPFHDYEISIISNYFHKLRYFFKIKYLNLRFKRKENL